MRHPLQSVDAMAVRRAMGNPPDTKKGITEVASQLRKNAEDAMEIRKRELNELVHLEQGKSLLDLEERSPVVAAPPPPLVSSSVGVVVDVKPSVVSSSQMVPLSSEVEDAARRVARLRFYGHWGKDVFEGFVEPSRSKCHWDHLIEEAVWLGREVHAERTWKTKAAKKVAQAARKGLEEMRLLTKGSVGGALDVRNTKGAEDEVQQKDDAKARKVARQTANMVRQWWRAIEVLVMERAQAVLDEHKRKAVSKHLELVVDQTQKFSKMLAGHLSGAPSQDQQQRQEDEGSADFVEKEGDEANDDLGTFLEAEKMVAPEEVAQEVEALKNEADMDINKLLEHYKGYERGKQSDEEDDDDDDEDEDEEEDEGEDEKKVVVAAAAAAPPRPPQVIATPAPPPSLKKDPTGRPQSKKVRMAKNDDDEFSVQGEGSADDLATFLEAKAEEKDGEVEKEIENLQDEANMDLEKLLAQYGGYRFGGGGSESEGEDDEEEEGMEEEDGEIEVEVPIVEEEVVVVPAPHQAVVVTAAAAEPSPKKAKVDQNDDEFVDHGDEDEMGTFLEAQREEVKEEVAKEVEALQDEATMDIEKLLAQYGGYKRERSEEEEEEEGEEDGDDDNEEEGDEDNNEEEEDRSMMASSADDVWKEGEPKLFGTELLLEGDAESGRAVMEDAAREAATAQPTGITLATCAVRTPLPSRLRGPPLREYQHIGLDWLVTMYNKGLNGILADEMGLGKTVMTISLLAHLAEVRGMWGPHLIVVPTSVLLNWEKEFKFWFPSFKILTYYGSVKQRQLKRQGWAQPNAFHVCITSYNVVIQDSSVFRRRQWQYLILDEAHNIRNFRSKRWQTLLGIRAGRRLLLTGTPLQNNLMELWSLLHFLMPHIFQSHSEFKEWFSAPMDAMIEGKAAVDQQLVDRLHTVLRPFLLRRLKKDVERQLPDKHEHVVLCRLSKRQRGLYEEFLNSRKVKETLDGGNVLGVMNVLMQLRKVCNHPDLFEERPIVSPLDLVPLMLSWPNVLVKQFAASDRGCAVQLPRNHASLYDCEVGNVASHLADRIRQESLAPVDLGVREPEMGARDLWGRIMQQRARDTRDRQDEMLRVSRIRGLFTKPLVGWDLRRAVSTASKAVKREGFVDQIMSWAPLFTFVIPSARAPTPVFAGHAAPDAKVLALDVEPAMRAIHVRQQLYFPDKRLIQYDCGKLQELAVLLERLKEGGHRVLIFTQMTRMLDILETFLTFHHHAYLRLDGSTSTDRRYQMMERFNEDKRLFCFILSTRSGGLGINLTGADTVIFFDTDWNPAIDAQAQDRAHRIGQTREVHVYRLISSKTVEENILRKAMQKRHLERLTLEDGEFNLAAMMSAGERIDLRELIGAGEGAQMTLDARAWTEAATAAEDGVDRVAAESALKEAAEGDGGGEEFKEDAKTPSQSGGGGGGGGGVEEELDSRIVEQLNPLQRFGYRFCQISMPVLDEEHFIRQQQLIQENEKRWEKEFRGKVVEQETALTYPANSTGTSALSSPYTPHHE